MKPTIALCMIVKDEADVIERCLSSVRKVGVDYWVIADTGSSDDTCERIQQALKGIPGELHHRPWKNFAHNRTEVCKLARNKADWLIWIDADGTLEGSFEQLPLPSAQGPDAWAIHLDLRGTRYMMFRILRSDLDWEYEFELHEHVKLDGRTAGFYGGVCDKSHPDGGRSKNPDKWRLDAAKLETMPRTPRTLIHLAQSYRECGEWAKARDVYRERAAIDNDRAEEQWVAQFHAARMGLAMGIDVVQEYLDAYAARPFRVEPLVDLARWYGLQEKWVVSRMFAKQALEHAQPLCEMIAVETDTHERALEAFAQACAQLGLLEDAKWGFDQLLKRRSLTDEMRERAEENLSRVECAIAETQRPERQLVAP